MLINCTLLVQILHAGVAYLIIRYLFLKPSVVAIAQEDALQASLIATIQHHQRTIAQKEQEIAAQWQEARRYFATHTPSLRLLPVPFFEKMPLLTLPSLSASTVAERAAAMATQLAEELEHVQ